jgi:hypothetical protein
VEDEEEEDSQEKNVQIGREIDYETEARKIQKKKKLLLLHVQPDTLFSSKSGMKWRSKASVLMKKKACNIVFANTSKKYFINFRSVATISVRKWWKKSALKSSKKTLFSSSSDRILEVCITPK